MAHCIKGRILTCFQFSFSFNRHLGGHASMLVTGIVALCNASHKDQLCDSLDKNAVEGIVQDPVFYYQSKPFTNTMKINADEMFIIQ